MRALRIVPLVAAALLPAGCGGGSGASSSAPAPIAAPAPNPGASPSPSPALAPEAARQLPLTGDLSPAHDPDIIKVGGTYFVFTTGHVGTPAGIVPMRSSTDLHEWTLHGASFAALPDWASAEVPGTRGIWAPGIYEHDGEYRMYYSVSTFGENRSVIGLRTTRALDPANPAAGWNDRGPVVRSRDEDDFNAIDPAPFVDAEGRHWLAFGSFWSGIKLVELDPATGMRLDPAGPMLALSSRPGPGAVEAPYIIRRGDHYYLFVSFDTCCRGAASTYNTVVGRSRAPEGPYVDAAGRPMLEGGGTPVLRSGQGEGSRFVGRGHVSILQEAGQDFIVYHAYDTQRGGASTLRIRRISWTPDGWPTAE